MMMKLIRLVRDEIIQCRERLWPQRPFKTDKDKKDLESDEKSERKRMALGRQQKLIESFANMREEFIKKHIDATGKWTTILNEVLLFISSFLRDCDIDFAI